MNGDSKISRQMLKDNGVVFDKHGKISSLAFGEKELQFLLKDVLRHMRFSTEREHLPAIFIGISSLHVENGHVIRISAEYLKSDTAIQNFPFLHRIDIKNGRLHLRHCPRLRSVVLHKELSIDQTVWKAGEILPLKELVRLRHECLYENGTIINPEGEINTSIFQSIKSLENEFIGYQNNPDELGLYLLIEKCRESLDAYLNRERKLKHIGSIFRKKVFYEDGVHETIHEDNTQIIYYHPGHKIYTEITLNTQDVTKNQYNYYESAEDLRMKKLRMLQVIADAEKLLSSLGADEATMISERTQYFDEMKSVWSNMVEVEQDHKDDKGYLLASEIRRFQKRLKALIEKHTHAHRGDYGSWQISSGKIHRLHLGDSLDLTDGDIGLIVGVKGGNALKVFLFARRKEVLLTREDVLEQVIKAKILD
jgi:hypothetical protein